MVDATKLTMHFPSFLQPSRAHRWIGGCKACGTGRKLEGQLMQARETWTSGHVQHYQVIAATDGSTVVAGDNGTNPSTCWVDCTCGKRVKLSRVYEGRKQSKHKCNAKCLGSKGPACDCRCGGQNHGSAHG